jgi:DHA1 family multidrug resistance protein-like MFS transporter
MTPAPRATLKRNQYVMAATVFVVFTGFAFVLPFLPLFVKELGVTDDERAALWAGVLIGVAPLLAGLLAPVWGHLADRFGQKRMALRALGAYVVLLALSALVQDVFQLLVLRVGVGLFGGIGPLGLAMATSGTPREETGRAVGLIQAAQILSAAVGPLCGGIAAHALGFRATFVVTAGVCAVAFFLVLFFYEEHQGTEPTEARSKTSLSRALRLPGLPFLLAILFLVNFIGRSFTPILPLHLGDLGVAPGRLALTTGFLISAYSIAAAVSATTLGRLTRRRSPYRLLVSSLAAGAACVLPMAIVPAYPAFFFCAILLGLASGGALTLCYTIGGQRVPQAQRATAFGFFSGAALFGGALSPSVAGLLAHWELRAIYYVNTALFLVLALTVALHPGKDAPPASDAPPAAGVA